jgi:hypothetical protein
VKGRRRKMGLVAAHVKKKRKNKFVGKTLSAASRVGEVEFRKTLKPCTPF